MIKKMYFIGIMLFVMQLLSAQCLVDYKKQMEAFEGEYLFHQEMDNQSTKRFSMILNGGSSYNLYLFNLSHKVSNYKLFNVSKNIYEPFVIDDKTSDYIKYKFKVDKTNHYIIELDISIEEKACALFAIFISDNYSEQTIQFSKQKSGNPPGTIKVNERFFVDETEIKNVDWHEFLSWIARFEGGDSDLYEAMLPDTTCWLDKDAYNEPLTEYYYSHPAYAEYPVVGVSYEQVEAYCQWRSDRVNQFLYHKNSKVEYDPNVIPENIPEVFRYRLPTKEEWEQLASFGYSEATEKKLLKIEEKGGRRSNFLENKLSENSDTLNEIVDITAPVNSYFPNVLGLYNMFGNVAEMVSEKGFAKGGSWMDSRKETTVKTDFKYTKPECWLGFRCVCERMD